MGSQLATCDAVSIFFKTVAAPFPRMFEAEANFQSPNLSNHRTRGTSYPALPIQDLILDRMSSRILGRQGLEWFRISIAIHVVKGSSNVRSTLTHTVNGQGATASRSISELLSETVESSAVILNRNIRVNGDVLAKLRPCAKIMFSLRPRTMESTHKTSSSLR
ncbi:hypothetical protein BDR05DRAFT_949090 [Suillus weaverae]|nr:hypothetical protein BDR05DRAFT_949090 [Suillus weaverae]